VVNVHIHQFKLGGTVVDAGALAQFQQQWATYRKLIASNDLSHREVGAILHDTLNEAFASPSRARFPPAAGRRRCQI
jgi:hypothetical protein